MINFSDFEKEFIAEHLTSENSKAICPSCGLGQTCQNNGVQGNRNQAGFRISSLICCTARNGCGKKARVKAWLQTSDMQEELELYLRKFEEAASKTAVKTIQQTKLNFKRQRCESQVETTEPVDWASEPVEPLPISLEMVMEKLGKLEEQIRSLQKENAALKAENATLKSTKKTYATAAATAAIKPPAKLSKRVALSVVAPQKPPVEFEKIHVKITNARPFKACKNMREVNALLKSVVESLGIQKLVTRASKIGNGILELYLAKPNKIEVLKKLAVKEAVIIEQLNLAEPPNFGNAELMQARTVKRLAHLCNRKPTFINLKKCILLGHSVDTIHKVEELLSSWNSDNTTTTDAMDITPDDSADMASSH